MMHEPPRDIPFYPDWLHDKLGPDHAKTWCIAARTTPRLLERYTLVITPKRNRELQAEHAAEVRKAVRRRLIEKIKALLSNGPGELVDAILADPAIAILVDHTARKTR
jgi:hypothetical protein